MKDASTALDEARAHTLYLSDVVRKLLEQGFHPAQIRQQLQRRGIPWRYRFTNSVEGRRVSVQGEREKARRLKRANLCTAGDGHPRAAGSTLCDYCLAAKWGAGRPIDLGVDFGRD